MATNTKPRNLIDVSASKKKSLEGSIKNSSSDARCRKSTTNISIMMKKTSSHSKIVTKTVTKTREKKMYSLPGQKYDVPEEREPLRLFYESLSKQIPSSEMAEFWLMEHGLLSPERAKKAYEKKQRKQKVLRTGTPVKSPPPPVSSKPESSRKTQPVPEKL
ncbi:hypothetical protein CDL12_16868 [Handroanthus impetiginosus]|uniref:Uncharacterized protein n=1 Tax=Handroanthus impetiginosus TaxID=429701 RepID=A0A2G9GZ43_9LAMI|nr:hypothetical protein CDL12_16868 [Handroanthus impetiginosus]